MDIETLLDNPINKLRFLMSGKSEQIAASLTHTSFFEQRRERFCQKYLFINKINQLTKIIEKWNRKFKI